MVQTGASATPPFLKPRYPLFPETTLPPFPETTLPPFPATTLPPLSWNHATPSFLEPRYPSLPGTNPHLELDLWRDLTDVPSRGAVQVHVEGLKAAHQDNLDHPCTRRQGRCLHRERDKETGEPRQPSGAARWTRVLIRPQPWAMHTVW